MGTTAEKLTYLNTTKQNLKTVINTTGAGLTDESTFRSYVNVLNDKILGAINGDVDLFEEYPKVSGNGADLSLNGVVEGKMAITPQGASSQESTNGKNLFHILDWDGTTVPKVGSNGAGLNRVNNNEMTLTAAGTWSNLFIDFGENFFNTNQDIIASADFLETISGRTSKVGLQFYGSVDGSSYTSINTMGGTDITYNVKQHLSVIANTGSYTYIRLRIWNNVTATSVTHGDSVINVSNIMVALGTDDTYEPYTGGIPAPNPSYPYPVNNVTGENSLILQNENLFDVNDITRGYELQPDGRTNVKPGWYVSDYIKVTPNTDYYLSGTKTSGQTNNFYDINKNVISYVNKLTGLLTTPNDCYYVRFNGLVTQLSDISFVKGSTAPTTYVEHEEQNYQLSLGNIELNSTPDGTIRDGIIGSSDVSYNLFDLNQFLSNAGIGTDGKIISATQNNLYYIPVKYGQNYKMSFTNTSATGNTLYGFCDELPSIDGNCTYNVVTIANLNGYVFTPTSATNKYLCIRLNRDNQLAYLSNIQITEGSEAKPYFPYGQVGMWYKREYIGKVVLDGSESGWRLAGTDTNTLRFTNDNIMSNSLALSTSLNVFMCNEFQKYFGNKGIGNIDSEGIAIRDTRNGFTIRILKTRVSDLSTFLTWLSEHNAIVYYVLENYEDIPITDTTLITQLNDIYNNTHSYNGVTNITTTYEDGNEQMYLDIEALKNVWEVTE